MTIPAFILTLLLSVMPNCASEDSYNCGWNASEMGNGKGHSFVTFGSEENYVTLYSN